MIITAGIDPGKKGSIVILADGATPLFVEETPVVHGNYIIPSMLNMLQPYGIMRAQTKLATFAAELQNLRQKLQYSETDVYMDTVLEDVASLEKAITEETKTRISLVVMEAQFIRHGEAAGASLEIGRGVGIWEAVLAANGIPRRTVSTDTWEKGVGIVRKRGEDAKPLHIKHAVGLVPKLVKNGTIPETIAEAALMAVYGYYEILREQNG